MGIKLFIVVDDKKEERYAAIEAIKVAFFPEGDEELPGLDIDGHESLGYKTSQVLILCAANLVDASGRLDFVSSSSRMYEKIVVLTDLMFPESKGNREQANGMQIVAACITKGLPVIRPLAYPPNI